jgi:predicted O-methyltransferase YrrM
MSKLTTALAKTPFVGRVALFAYRSQFALGYFYRPLFNLLKWLIHSKETTNFTYDLEDKNKRYLASMIADVVNLDFREIMAYFKEIEQDEDLRKHIADATARSDWAFTADKEVRLGSRIGWYAIARATKPKIAIEAGVDKGLGSCVITAALKKNSQEGYAGRYYGLDINPKAGYLLSEDYANYGSMLYGDSVESLEKFNGVVDLYVSDSDHSPEYEAREYRAIAGKLSERAIVLGDNSHVTDKLLEFSLAANRHFVFFQEKPFEHWYPGGGFGISYKR